MRDPDRAKGSPSAAAGGEAGGTTRRAPRWWIAGLLSIIPGAGHMYLGLIGKGFALMGLLFASVFLVILYSDATQMYWMTAYLIPTLCVLFLSYAVFDCRAIASALQEGRRPAAAEDPAMEAIWEKVLLNRRTLGWVVVVAGAVGLLRVFSAPLDALVASWLGIEFPVMGLVIPVILLAIGISLLRRGRGGR